MKLWDDHEQVWRGLDCFGTYVPTCLKVSKLENALPAPLLRLIVPDMLGDILGSGHPPKDYTKPRHTEQSPNRLYKALDRQYKDPTDYRKPQKHYTKTRHIKQKPTILNMNLKYSTRVATNID